ncbi:MAG: DEAD/DEAH box helicase [bacterium]
MSNDLFQKLGVSQKFQAALDAAGFVTPSKIQDQAIPALIEGRDVLGIAQTGTGKTAAFGLPLLQRLDARNSPAQPKHPLGLVLAPTRELAIQIHKELTGFAASTSLRLGCIYGGVGQNPQVKMLRNGLDILIATPGRLLDLIGQQHVKLGHVELLVLDEADRLLDMGFIRDVKRIVAATPRKRQSLLFSATMPDAVAELAAEMLHKPVRVEVAPRQVTVEKIDQRVTMVATPDKLAAMEHILRRDDVKKAIAFTRTKHGADKVARKLRNAGINAEAIHGNKSQNARNRALDAFKNGDAWVLVATDIAARGIDIDGVTHVVNFELPHEPESYVHRIGRTGRAGAAGSAWSLVDPSEVKRLRAVEKLIRMPITQEDLDIEVTVPVERIVQQKNDPDQGQKRRRPRRRRPSRAAA